MRELTIVETDQAGGGIIGQIAAFIVGFLGSYAASYAYEESGGADGINEALSDFGDAAINTIAAQQSMCQETGAGCGINLM